MKKQQKFYLKSKKIKNKVLKWSDKIMKKKIIIGIMIVLILLMLILLSTLVLSRVNKTDIDVNKEGNKIFGEEYCSKNCLNNNDGKYSGIAGMAFTTYECEICNKKYEHPNTATPKICSTCAIKTNRCEYCGKLKNEN